KKQLLSDLKELDASQQHAILAWSITIKDQKEELQNLKTLQASSQCDSQCQKLVAYSISELEPVINDKNLYRDAKREALLFSIIQELQMGGFLPKSSKAPQSAVSVSNTGKTTIDSVVKSGEQASKSIARSEAELLSDTSKQLEKYVNAFANSKYKPATAIGALDPLTGKIVTTSNGSVPTIIAPELQAYADRLGGLGVKTACGNTLGRCAEFRAANELLLANPSLKVKDIQFTPAIRPRTGEVVPRCENCKNIFGGE
ncbi:hypothetical protein SMC87_003064, partial [Cronobacter dublinensis]|nr:hypothetical protein [Cronobacter dublinensis]